MKNNKIKAFVERWTGKGYEKGQSQLFWTELLTDVLGVETPSEVISFEDQVKLDHTAFIDAYIKKTHVMIEQKSINKDLRTPIKQSDGTELTPFRQAKRYASELPYSQRPRWIITCNFRSFHIYDMEHPQSEPFIILLENLEKEAHMLQFIVNDDDVTLKHEKEVSIQAGEMVGRIYDAFLSQFGDDITKAELHALNVLCVRLVFCLYAEDAGIFGKDQFYHYMKSFSMENMSMALRELFQVLDTPINLRNRFLEEKLAAFPYVNGSLFSQQPGELIPPFSQEIVDCLLDKASISFDWSDISPTIFGAVFESTLNPDTRRSGGMHYTSIENIHKVIDPLFMDDLNEEFANIRIQPNGKLRDKRLEAFQTKLASLKFFDPACGSGNFLTETFISLRRLENRVILELTHGEVLLGFDEANPIKVNIHQFYGIEINDFAVTVATTALWIAEAQMMAETEKIIRFENDYLPLKSYNNIHEGNSLRIPWEEVVSPQELDYIIGNPPFVGYSLQSKEQKEDILSIYVDEKGKPYKTAGKIDYVAGWYWKASQLMATAAEQGHTIRTALVSTNSITQGEQVAGVWKPLYDRFNIHIDFAWRTFRWDSESSLKAHVHCVIVGFSIMQNNAKRKLFFSEENCKECKNINAYLTDAPIVFIESNKKSLCNVTKMYKGSQPTDGGNYFLSFEDKKELLHDYPFMDKYIKRFYGATEFLHNKDRFCFWLVNANPSDLKSCPPVLKRLESVRAMRLESSKEATRKCADTPTLFQENRQPSTDYILVPRHSSENRRYIPLGFLPHDIICGDANLMIPNATLYDFAILESNVHMAWMRAVCGRLEMRYRYSKDIVYNNFPWPTPTDAQKAKIEETAQAILDARALYPDSSLADLYDETTMPPELRKAHQQNDRAVMAAYGFPAKDFTESDIVAELLKMYKELTK